MSDYKNVEKNDSVLSGTASSGLRSEGNEVFLISRRRKWFERGALVVSGLLYAAAFPPLELTFISWFAIVPLMWILREKSGAAAWRGGYIWGYFFTLASFFWLREIEFLIPFVTGFVLAFFFAFWVMPMPFLYRMLLVPCELQLRGYESSKNFADFKFTREILFVAAMAGWWSVLEWVRTWIFTGLPWNFLGAAHWQHISLIQISEFCGVYGVSFLVALFNVALFTSLLRIKSASRGKKYPFVLTVSVLFIISCMAAGPYLAGRWSLEKSQNSFSPAVLQGDIPQCRMATEEQAMNAMNKYFLLSRKAASLKPDIIIWPETAVPVYYRANWQISGTYRQEMKKFMQEFKIPILFGTIDFEDNKNEPEIYNTAMLIDENCRIRDRYSKVHIVPFGEFVPLSKYFPALVRMIGMGRGLSPGKTFNPIELRSGIKAGISICFEDVFPYVSASHVLAGANMLLVITNDAWYPKSSEPKQHLANSVFRAVETRRPMLRCGNNSASCLIGTDGAIKETVFPGSDPALRGEGLAVFKVKYDSNPELSFYTRHGDVFILLCCIISGLAALAALWAWREKKLKLISLVEVKK